MTTQKYPFYFLNWCNSNGMHKYTEGQINEPIESIEGVNYFDDEIHESFFQVSFIWYTCRYKIGPGDLDIDFG